MSFGGIDGVVAVRHHLHFFVVHQLVVVEVGITHLVGVDGHVLQISWVFSEDEGLSVRRVCKAIHTTVGHELQSYQPYAIRVFLL